MVLEPSSVVTNFNSSMFSGLCLLISNFGDRFAQIINRNVCYFSCYNTGGSSRTVASRTVYNNGPVNRNFIYPFPKLRQGNSNGMGKYLTEINFTPVSHINYCIVIRLK